MSARKTTKPAATATNKPEQPHGVRAVHVDTSSTSLITMLERIATDENVSARERTVAARAVMEARGQLGKHQRAPGDGTAEKPLSDLSRPELEAELARLRLHFAARASEMSQ